MDILYYSNYCKHSQKILQFLVKANLTNQIHFICIDKRYVDPKSGQIHIKLENGKVVVLPPNVSSVPTLLLVNQKYKAVLGDDIAKIYESKVQTSNNVATGFQGEPQAYQLGGSSGGMNIVSEQYTFYNMSPDELAAKGKGGMRQMYNYVNANHETATVINTPPDTYRPDKVSNSVTVETLQQKRMEDVGQQGTPNPMAPVFSSI
jgi:hypothetical protein